MRQALAPLLFDDQEIATERNNRDPVAPAKPSDAARQKKALRVTEDALPLHSFTTLLAELGTRCRHLGRLHSDPESPPIVQDTEPTPIQARALAWIRLFPVPDN
ncbi:MAG: hypothetical protein ACRERS_03730 [Methylococcales bacterium]